MSTREDKKKTSTTDYEPNGKGPVHTAPKEFVNAALFPRLGLPSTLIRHENRTFRKRSSNRRNFKTPVLRFRVNGKPFENGVFENDDITIII